MSPTTEGGTDSMDIGSDNHTGGSGGCMNPAQCLKSWDIMARNESFQWPITKGLEVVLVVDEVHVLGRELSKGANEHKIDSFYRTVNHLRTRPMSLVVLSTQSDMKVLAPSKDLQTSSRMMQAADVLNPPLTESPFDHRLQNIDRSKIKLDMLADPLYKALYGRPLFVRSHCSFDSPADY